MCYGRRVARSVFLASLTLCAACATPMPPPPIVATASRNGDGCRVRIDGRAYPDFEAPTAAARAWRGRRAEVRGDIDTPYRCIGGAVFALQRAGIKRVTFVAGPAAPERP